MNKISIGVMLLVSATVLVTPALASFGSCASPQPLNSTVVGPAEGCSYMDNNFVNFNVGAPSGSGDASWPVPSSGASSAIEFLTAGTNPYILDFRTTGESIGTTSCAANSFCTPGGGDEASQSITYDAQSTGYGYDRLALEDGPLQPGTTAAGDVVTTQELFCLGAATFSCTDTSLGYGYLEITDTSNGSGGYTTVDTVCRPIAGGGCTAAAAGSANIALGKDFADIGIEDTVTITTVGGESSTVFIDYYENGFGEGAPEPSTFVLLGTGLAGFAILRCRRKKA